MLYPRTEWQEKEEEEEGEKVEEEEEEEEEEELMGRRGRLFFLNEVKFELKSRTRGR